MGKNSNSTKIDYKKRNKLKRLFRVVNNLTFWLLVISGSIVLLLFSEGYSISVDEQKITQNGAISVKSQPEGATVYLNGERRGTTPTVLPSIKPDTHTVTVEREGFITWTQEITLEKQRAVYIEAQLLRFNENGELRSDNPVQSFYTSKDGEHIFYISGDNQQALYYRPLDYSIINLNREEQLLSDNCPDCEYTSLTAAEQSPLAISILSGEYTEATGTINKTSDQGNTFALIDTTQDNPIRLLPELRDFQEPTNFSWLSGDEKFTFESDGRTYLFDLDQDQTTLLFESTIYTHTSDGNISYVNNTEASLRTINTNTFETNDVSKLENPQEINSIHFLPNSEQILMTTTTEILLIGESPADLPAAIPDSPLEFVNPQILEVSQDSDLTLIQNSGDLLILNPTESQFTQLKITTTNLEPANIKIHPTQAYLIYTKLLPEIDEYQLTAYNIQTETEHSLYLNTLSKGEFKLQENGSNLLFKESLNSENYLFEISLLESGFIGLDM